MIIQPKPTAEFHNADVSRCRLLPLAAWDCETKRSPTVTKTVAAAAIGFLALPHYPNHDPGNVVAEDLFRHHRREGNLERLPTRFDEVDGDHSVARTQHPGPYLDDPREGRCIANRAHTLWPVSTVLPKML